MKTCSSPCRRFWRVRLRKGEVSGHGHLGIESILESILKVLHGMLLRGVWESLAGYVPVSAYDASCGGSSEPVKDVVSGMLTSIQLHQDSVHTLQYEERLNWFNEEPRVTGAELGV